MRAHDLEASSSLTNFTYTAVQLPSIHLHTQSAHSGEQLLQYSRSPYPERHRGLNESCSAHQPLVQSDRYTFCVRLLIRT